MVTVLIYSIPGAQNMYRAAAGEGGSLQGVWGRGMCVGGGYKDE